MPNYTVADAKKHNKGLTDKQARQWKNVANSAYARCLKEGKKNCDGLSIRVANGVLKKHRAEEVDVILECLESEEFREEVLDGFDHQFCPELFDTDVVETVVLEDGASIDFLDREAYFVAVEETSFLPTDDSYVVGEAGILEETDDGKHLAVYRALQGRNTSKGESGISKNKNFYSGEVAEALAPLLEERRKMYLNHKAQEKMGRPLEDWAGVINESWAKEGASFVKTDVLTENPDTGWIWEVMKKYPDQIGVSIFAFVKGRRATIDKMAVFAVEGWRRLCSLDFVGDPSAGGTLQSIESVMAQEGIKTEEPGDQKMAKESVIIEAFAKSLSTEVDKSKRRSALNSIGWLVTDLIRSAAFDKDTDEEGRKKNIKSLVKEFGIEIDKIDPVGLYKEYLEGACSGYYYENATSEAQAALLETAVDLVVFQACEAEVSTDSTLVEAVLQEASGADAFREVVLNEVRFSDATLETISRREHLPSTSFLIVGDHNEKSTWHLPYKDALGAVNKEALEALEHALDGQHKLSIPAAVKSKIERLLKAAGVGKTVVSNSPPHQEADTVNVDELKKLTWEQLVVACPAAATRQEEHVTALSEAKTAKETAESATQVAESAKTTATSAAAASAKELDERKLKDAIQEEATLVSRLLEASEILDPKDDKIVSPIFRDELLRLAKEGEEPVKKAIEDRETLIVTERAKKVPGVTGNGQRKEPGVPAVEGTGNGSAVFEGVPVVESATKEALVSNLKVHR